MPVGRNAFDFFRAAQIPELFQFGGICQEIFFRRIAFGLHYFAGRDGFPAIIRFCFDRAALPVMPKRRRAAVFIYQKGGGKTFFRCKKTPAAT
ncbi:hypothetical protein [Neisseria lactamica]|uniref:hypothetical protein n=1 Tax=Neisseria lactamica TaxID=486 RepID=UPI0005A9E9D9|nr:hypothetical protein [Neisseria lactamica]